MEEIIRDAVTIETEFIIDAIPGLTVPIVESPMLIVVLFLGSRINWYELCVNDNIYPIRRRSTT